MPDILTECPYFRDQESETVFKAHCETTVINYRDPADLLLIELFGCTPLIINGKIQAHKPSGPLANWILQANKFPYKIPPGKVHLVIWTIYSEYTIEEAARTAEYLLYTSEFEIWQNPKVLQSVKNLKHFHIVVDDSYWELGNGQINLFNQIKLNQPVAMYEYLTDLLK